MRALTTADLFSGAGGLTLGFAKLSKGRFKPVFAIDSDPDAARSYNANFGPHCRVADLAALLDSPDFTPPPVDLVVGGPPCQGFSLLNKNRRDDPRKALWTYFLDFTRRSGAGAFLMENVPELLKSAEFDAIRASAESLGFQLAWGVLNAADYGVAQVRKRAFILGCAFADPARVFPPKPTHAGPRNGRDHLQPDLPPWRTVRDAVADLPPAPDATELFAAPSPLDLHCARSPTELSRKRYAVLNREGMNRFDLQRLAPDLTPPCWIRKTSGGVDLMGRLWWDRPAHTIRTEFFKPEKGRYLHPCADRPLTHREAARLQSFPDDFRFLGGKTSIAKQIGNAVPPLLGAAVADAVYGLFFG